MFSLMRKLEIKEKKDCRSGEEGQSTVEFALTMVLFFAFIFFYFQLTMVMAWGNFVHYAVFMAARAYQSGAYSVDDQRARAREVIVRNLKKSIGQSGIDRFPSIAKGNGGSEVKGLNMNSPGEFEPGSRASGWMQGIRYTFKSRLFMIPLAGRAGQGEMNDSVNSLTLTAESWLGREPTYRECQDEMDSMNGAIFDNGC